MANSWGVGEKLCWGDGNSRVNDLTGRRRAGKTDISFRHYGPYSRGDHRTVLRCRCTNHCGTDIHAQHKELEKKSPLFWIAVLDFFSCIFEFGFWVCFWGLVFLVWFGFSLLGNGFCSEKCLGITFLDVFVMGSGRYGKVVRKHSCWQS